MIIIVFFIIVLVCLLIVFRSKPETEGHTCLCQVDNLKYFGFKNNGHSISVWPHNNTIGGQIEFYIAGVSYREGIDNYIGETEGQLVAENDNPHDSNAIMVLAADGHHLGYVPKELTLNIRKSVKLPYNCYCYIAKHVENGEVKYFTSCYIILPKS